MAEIFRLSFNKTAVQAAIVFGVLTVMSEPPHAVAQEGMSPQARQVIGKLSAAERKQFFDLSRRERRAFISQRMSEGGSNRPSSENNQTIDDGLNPKSPRAVQKSAGLFNTGVKAIYPAGAKCLEAKSFFGDQTRHDGSSRTPHFYQGYHEGLDISAEEGTPLVALADGEVVHRYTGGRLVGNQIYLRHTPDDTGLPVYIYSKYKHFRDLPDLKIGARVKMGQVIGYSGKTGTTGGHFGQAGYPHLHLSIYVAPNGEYKTLKIKIAAENLRYFDPIALYLMGARKTYDNPAVRALSDGDKRVHIPYKSASGKVMPKGTRLIWPFLCAD
ncbi:MAG: M23 family metallopeptidase [Rhodospirillales bacterium]|nr:M23 family metallopeptidase [Rhodospirillales bacterium]